MKPTSSSVNSVLNRILAMKFASEFILIYPLITIMYADRGHVSAAGIGVILATGMILSVLLEVPTGIIADKVSRKYVLISALSCKTTGLFIWLLMPYFWGYMLAAVFFALGSALESGTLQAYMYGVMGDESKKAFGKFWARVNSMVMISYSVAYVLTTIVGVKYPALISLSIIPCLVALGLCLSLPTDHITPNSKSLKPRIFVSAVGHIKSSPKLIKLLISGVIMVALAELLIEYISLYYNQIGVTTRFIPILMAIGNLLGAYLFWTLHSWEHSLDKYKLPLLFVVTGLFIASFYGGIFIAATGVLLYTRLIRVFQVQYESRLQHLSNNEARATISSIGSFAASLLAGGMSILIGVFAVNNIILRPFRVTLILGSLAFICVHAFIRYKDTEPVAD